MSTFHMRDEYYVRGEKYDEEQGFREICEDEGGEYEPYMVEFIRAWMNNTWDTVRVHVPLDMAHEKCTHENLVDWYTKVYSSQYIDLAFVGVYKS